MTDYVTSEFPWVWKWVKPVESKFKCGKCGQELKATRTAVDWVGDGVEETCDIEGHKCQPTELALTEKEGTC